MKKLLLSTLMGGFVASAALTSAYAMPPNKLVVTDHEAGAFPSGKRLGTMTASDTEEKILPDDKLSAYKALTLGDKPVTDGSTGPNTDGNLDNTLQMSHVFALSSGDKVKLLLRAPAEVKEDVLVGAPLHARFKTDLPNVSDANIGIIEAHRTIGGTAYNSRISGETLAVASPQWAPSMMLMYGVAEEIRASQVMAGNIPDGWWVPNMGTGTNTLPIELMNGMAPGGNGQHGISLVQTMFQLFDLTDDMGPYPGLGWRLRGMMEADRDILALDLLQAIYSTGLLDTEIAQSMMYHTLHDTAVTTTGAVAIPATDMAKSFQKAAKALPAIGVDEK